MTCSRSTGSADGRAARPRAFTQRCRRLPVRVHGSRSSSPGGRCVARNSRPRGRDCRRSRTVRKGSTSRPASCCPPGADAYRSIIPVACCAVMTIPPRRHGPRGVTMPLDQHEVPPCVPGRSQAPEPHDSSPLRACGEQDSSQTRAVRIAVGFETSTSRQPRECTRACARLVVATASIRVHLFDRARVNAGELSRPGILQRM